MEWFREVWNQISTVFNWWVIILPWELGLRIRLGKNVKVLNPGIHFRIPYVDSCYKQGVRLNYVNLSPQTLTASTGETITLSIIVGYSITDILKVYNSISEIHGAISGSVMGMISDFISKTPITECRPEHIESSAKNTLSTKDWGISISDMKIVSFAVVKTYRLIQDNAWMSQSHELKAKI